ncbi:MAG: response regulator [Oscillibacter sp.]|nr:response regulator [Oscillibacter sp.]
MVVDDSRMVFLQIEALLADSDYEIVAYCQDGNEALEQYGQVNPDLVTMDIIMPGMDGLETVQAILEEYPDAKIVMLSSLAYEDTFTEAREVGAKAFLDKCFDRQQLLDVFEQVLADAETEES